MVFVVLALAGQDSGAKTQEKADTKEVQADSPERAIRSFIVSLMTGDAAGLLAVTLPVEDLGSIIPPKLIPPESHDAFKAQIAEMPIRILKAGEEVKLAGGRTYKARPEDVGPDRAVVLPEKAAYPLACRKFEGRWRVDVSPIVASMKAAANQDPTPPKTIDPGPIKDKITIKPGQEVRVRFTRDGDAISAPKVVTATKDEAKAQAKPEIVHFDFSKKDEDLMLTTQNPFSKNFVFRADARYKGRTTYLETSIVPVKAGIFGIETWRDPIEELLLFDFKLVDE
jgi:hypothetical protein